MEWCDQLYTPIILGPGKYPSYPFEVGWVPRAGLHDDEKRTISCPNPIVQSVARLYTNSAVSVPHIDIVEESSFIFNEAAAK
jgi:hypothetical protein